MQQQAQVTLTIYNLRGQEVTRLVDSVKQPGRYTAIWTGANATGRSVASDVYFYRQTTDAGFVQSRRMTLLK